MVEKPNKFQAAILAGIIFGLLSAIPFVQLVNACCCLWVVIGGAFAARTLITRSPVFPVSSGDGALVGLMSGAVMSVIYLVVGIPLGLLASGSTMALVQRFAESVSDPKVREQLEQVRQMQGQPMAEQIAGALVQWLIVSVLAIGFATLGGVIGVAMFEKRKGQPPTMPPQPPAGYPGYPPPPGGQPPTY